MVFDQALTHVTRTITACALHPAHKRGISSDRSRHVSMATPLTSAQLHCKEIVHSVPCIAQDVRPATMR
jgi:hypothetical protein